MKERERKMRKPQGKVAIVTGASKGIGASIATHLAAEGAAVVVNYATSKAGADRVVSAMATRGGKAIAVQANVAHTAEIERLFAATEHVVGRLDMLVNNAAIIEFRPREGITEEHVYTPCNVHLLGPIFATQHAVQHCGSEGGSIINMRAAASRGPQPGGAVSSASKGALESLTRACANERGPHKIRVKAMRPGLVETEGVRAAGVMESPERTYSTSRAPCGRIGQPSDIATVAVFLASSDSGWITGETLRVQGGVR